MAPKYNLISKKLEKLKKTDWVDDQPPKKT